MGEMVYVGARLSLCVIECIELIVPSEHTGTSATRYSLLVSCHSYSMSSSTLWVYILHFHCPPLPSCAFITRTAFVVKIRPPPTLKSSKRETRLVTGRQEGKDGRTDHILRWWTRAYIYWYTHPLLMLTGPLRPLDHRRSTAWVSTPHRALISSKRLTDMYIYVFALSPSLYISSITASDFSSSHKFHHCHQPTPSIPTYAYTCQYPSYTCDLIHNRSLLPSLEDSRS